MERGASEEPSVSIRTASVADYDAIVELWQRAGLKASLRGRESRESYAQQLMLPTSTFLVAVLGDRVVGVVFGTHDGRKGWINRLAVDPQLRGRGIAKTLTERCQDAIRAAGIEIIAALVEPDNGASRALFESLGYKADVPVVYYRLRNRTDV